MMADLKRKKKDIFQNKNTTSKQQQWPGKRSTA
jgi:hypothetical protein